MEKMTKKAEKKLVESVSQMIDLVNSGSTPTAALIKVAGDKDHSAEEIRRVGNIYNQSKTLMHFSKSADTEKANVFAIADPEEAIDSLYPSTIPLRGESEGSELAKAAYAQPQLRESFIGLNLKAQQFRKAAECTTHVDGESKKPAKAPNDRKTEKMKIEKEARLVQASLLTQLYKLGEDIRATFYTQPFEKLEEAVLRKYGKHIGAPLAELLWQVSGAEKLNQKRARRLDYSNDPLFDFGISNFATVENLVNTALDLQKKAVELAQMQNEEQKEQAELQKQSAAKAEEEKSDISRFFRKQSIFELSQATAKAVGDRLNQVPDKGTVERKLLEDQLMKLEDPDFRNQEKQVQIQTMLHDLISNDPVISSYDPDEVIDLFNQIYEVAPEAATKPALMRGWLRQSLEQGGLAPFEAGSIVDQNKLLNQTADAYARKGTYEELIADPKALTREVAAREAQSRRPSPDTVKTLNEGFVQSRENIKDMFNSMGKLFKTKNEPKEKEPL